MHRLHRIGIGIVLAAVSMAALAVTWSRGPRADDSEEARLTSRMKTMCIGRFLIDLPEQARVELWQARVDGFDISAFNESEVDFQKRVTDRESQIKAIPDRLGGRNNLESVRDAASISGLIGKLFMHSRTVDEGSRGNGLGGVERYRHEGITTEALVHQDGVSIDLFFANRDPRYAEDLPKLVSRLKTNPENRLPAEPGFCLDRVYVRDPLRADQLEQIMMSAWLPDHPDVEIRLILAAGLKPDNQGLLERTKAANRNFAPSERKRITQHRAAPRQIAGILGEEVAETINELNKTQGHSFWWEVNGTEDNVFVPHVVFQMSTGNSDHGPVASSLSVKTALGVWDKISSSIRLRPVKAPTPHPTQTRSGAPALRKGSE